ncbi:TAP42-like protein [Bombardia bombarda]|uniref:TAP42-like protein n=1 Tax=Bombardia bombarda TaxID=252184 RepID=A0AA40CHE1_9PEZI|nr:TAP42-like protein [Bombardia bombarda]
MDDDEAHRRSLKTVFADAEAKRLSLSTSHDPDTSRRLDSVASTVRDYQTCLALLRGASIFSPNESLEDISTSSLPYLLVDFHLAELLQQLPSSSPVNRLQSLSSARDAYERYLHLLDSYGLLSPSHAKLLEHYTDAPTTFSTVTASDPSVRRTAKIANLNAEKELRAKLDFLRRRPEYADFDSDSATPTSGADEDAVRAVHLANIAFHTHLSFQALESLNREVDILSHAPNPRSQFPTRTTALEDADTRQRQQQLQQNSDGQDSRLDNPLLSRLQSALGGPLLTKQGKPLQPFTLVNNRQELAAGVFRPGHNLPTMTIDEYLDEEYKRGGMIEGGGEASGMRPEPDEDDIEKADAETYKARQWDEFTESNAKGSGNTLNRG